MIFSFGGTVGTPVVGQQLEFAERKFVLTGGPKDPRKREALYAEFRLLAQEAEIVVSSKSSRPTTTVDDWLDRLRYSKSFETGASTGIVVERILTESARHLKALRVNELRVRNQKQAEGADLPDLERYATLAVSFEALCDKYFTARGEEDFSAVMQEACQVTEHETQSMGGSPHGKNKPGPQQDRESARRIREIVTRIASADSWKRKLDDICEALDNEKIPWPKTWSKREPPIGNWIDAAVTDRDLAKKAIEYRLKIAQN